MATQFRKLKYCVDCGSVAEKNCKKCGLPLCVSCVYGNHGYCVDCVAEVVEYEVNSAWDERYGKPTRS